MFQQGRQNERMVDALALSAEEGRGNAAKSLGESLAGSDPKISEWGNPLERVSSMMKGTGGTETSKVPRGKESIPVVVASESGKAQTRTVSSRVALRLWGCRTVSGGIRHRT